MGKKIKRVVFNKKSPIKLDSVWATSLGTCSNRQTVSLVYGSLKAFHSSTMLSSSGCGMVSMECAVALQCKNCKRQLFNADSYFL